MKALPSVIGALQIQQDGSIASATKSNAIVTSCTPLDTRLVYLAVILLPYGHLQYVVKNKNKNVVEFMMREGIKFKNKDVVLISRVTDGMDDMLQLLKRTPQPCPTSRLQVGQLLRDTKEMWVTTMVVATVALMRKKFNVQVNWGQRAQEWYKIIVFEMELDGCWNTKPLLNGKDLIQLLGLNNGPSVGLYAQEQIQWMLMNPKGSLEELQQHLKVSQKAREFEENQAAQHISKKMHL
jgi:hypothetical protein